MKTALVICATLVAAFTALLLVPALQPHAAQIAVCALLLALATLALAIFSARAKKKQPSAAPPPPAPAANQAEAEITAFLALLQEKGRFVDFLMDDVTAYNDAQVGAAARVVHQGCREVLREHFKIVPVADAEEGSQFTAPAEHAPDEFRLRGKVSGEPPFTGTLIHKGWKTGSVKLPRILKADEERLPVIAPAEIELK